MSHESQISLSESVGIVGEEEAKLYKPLLQNGETLRIFRPHHLLTLLDAIPGEEGKALRITHEETQTVKLSDGDRMRLNHLIIRWFFKTTTHAQDVRFLEVVRPDDSTPDITALYPVALSELKPSDKIFT